LSFSKIIKKDGNNSDELELEMRKTILWCSLACFISVVAGDNLFFQGFYDYETLPGNLAGSKPNEIAAHDVNRPSDGVSTTSAYTTTSPRFPYYFGAAANISDRYLHFAAYSRDAAAQGLAVSGSGDAEAEAARLKVMSRSDYQSLPRPTKTFPVYAAIKWNPSHFAIQAGESYEVSALPTTDGTPQYWQDGGIQVTAEGYSSYFDSISNCFVGMGRCRSHLKKRRRIPTANWLSLACAIGNFVRPLTETEPGKESESRYVPLDESQLNPTLFTVGLRTEFLALYSGQLICFANDAHTTYWNNMGAIEVTVTRTSWPPVHSEYYQEKRLPACDSASMSITARMDPWSAIQLAVVLVGQKRIFIKWRANIPRELLRVFSGIFQRRLLKTVLFSRTRSVMRGDMNTPNILVSSISSLSSLSLSHSNSRFF
jgi:hypothetical protein